MSLDWAATLKDVYPCCRQTIESLGFSHPTPVQANVIPHFCAYKDVVVEAVTGSGKTLAFLIPIFHKLLSLPEPLPPQKTGGLIISPTRELSDQIFGVAQHFLSFCKLKLALITGGIRSHEDDLDVIAKGSNIVVGTPGRIFNVLSNGYLNVSSFEVLVFDEADRLLELGFESQINSILSMLPKQRRTGLFSATQSKNVEQLIRVGLRNPIRIELKIKNKKMKTQLTPKLLKNEWMKVEEGKEMLYFMHLLFNIAAKQKVIFFMLSCAEIDYVRSIIPILLKQHGIDSLNVWYLHGRYDQKLRTKIYSEFERANIGALICTDLCARGIDIPDIDVIVQCTPPQKIEMFTHRVGRTARNGKTGSSIVLLRDHEIEYLQLLKLKKVPISKQICLQFKERIFSKKDEENEQNDEHDIEKDEVKALTTQIQDILVSDRAIFDRAHRAFVSFAEAYRNHQSPYIFRLSLLNCGKIGNGMGLLYLPKLKKIRMHGRECFVERPDVDFDAIAYKNKKRERERQQKLKKNKQRRVQREERRKLRMEKEKVKGSLELHKNQKKQRQKKRKWKSDKDEQQQNKKKKQKRMSHKLREFKHYQKEEVLLKQLKKNYISQETFDKEMGYKL